MEEVYEIHALRYGSNQNRTRQENFLETVDDHDSAMPLDYFIWLIRNENRAVVVDTGFDHIEAKKRGRTISALPSERLAQLGIDSKRVEDVIITHLHYDHAGTLKDFPNARFHLQETEMQFATGPWMLEDAERFAYSTDHVAELIHCLFAKRVRFHQQDGEVAPGITVHRMSGHTKGDAVGEGAYEARMGFARFRRIALLRALGQTNSLFHLLVPGSPAFKL